MLTDTSAIDWEGVTVVDRETDRCAIWIIEAIWIRKIAPTINRDEEGYRLSHSSSEDTDPDVDVNNY